jgi:hypothetical protein
MGFINHPPNGRDAGHEDQVRFPIPAVCFIPSAIVSGVYLFIWGKDYQPSTELI